MDGAGNCQNLTDGRAVQIVKQYRAASPADTYDDWYIPSAGEWSYFVTGEGYGGEKTDVYELVENALLKNGKTPLGNSSYWSSTARDVSAFSSAWYVDFTTDDINYINTWQYRKLRAMRTFDVSFNEGRGGGIHALGSRIEGCLIQHNSAPEGSGAYLRGDAQIINCTFVNNSQLPKADPVSLNAQVMDAGTSVVIGNTIISGNTNANAQPANWVTGMSAAYSAIETSGALTGEGNINITDGNVEFLDYASANYRLKETSSCVNAGNPALLPTGLTTDLDGKARTTNGKISIGAFESFATVGINDPDFDSFVRIFPNPVQRGGYVQIESGNTAVVKAILGNALGNTIQIIESSGINSIRMPEIPGVYFIQLLQSDGKHKEFKVIVTN
jgi:hypothetical protein